MNKKIKYIFSDIDGTIISHNGEVFKETKEYINNLKNKGIKFGLVTGRSPIFAKHIAEQISPDLPLITNNGGQIYENYNNDVSIYEKKINEQAAGKIIKYIIKNNIPAMGFGDKSFFSTSIINGSTELERVYKNIAKHPVASKREIKELNSEMPMDIFYKILVLGKELSGDQRESLHAFLNSISDKIDFYYSGHQGLDIMPKSVSKGSALEWLAKNKYIDLDETIVFGDEENDVSMFKIIDMSFAMKNGTKEAKKAANFETKHTNDNNGVVRELEDLFNKKS